jgi:membrane protein
MTARELLDVIKEAGQRWWYDNTFRLGAALAFYTVFSLAPLILLTLAVGGLLFSEETVRQQMTREFTELAGQHVAEAFERTAASISQSGGGLLATVVSVVLLLVGATSVFGQLQDALNTIWGVKSRPEGGVLAYIKDQFWSFALVVGIGFLLLVSLLASTVLSALAGWLKPSSLPGGILLWQVINWLVSLGMATVLFAMIYKVLPAVDLGWRDVWVGALVTAVLFELGKDLIGLYLGRSMLVSAYGAAGSLVVILMWVYYSSQILLLGAEFTYVYAVRTGKVPATRGSEPPEGSHGGERPPRANAPGTPRLPASQSL